MPTPQRFRFICTLTFGDISGQVLAWLTVIFISVAGVLASLAANNPSMAYFTVALIMVASLPFLLFAFVTTLFNHIELEVMDEKSAQASAFGRPMAPQRSVV